MNTNAPTIKSLKANARRAEDGRYGYNLHNASGALFLFDFRTGETRRLTGALAAHAHSELERTDAEDLDYCIDGLGLDMDVAGSLFLSAALIDVDAESMGA